ncbi:hypothetical protein FSARC_10253 [Fusarium sarcochroum]|uniref:Uncharacterized protein n=1 Tax=Fusarium sarcochroum TaxID=1208366 RepID=A0A8H4TNF0_9HYPO|nr:hypothetical protein FSARC_10253 [Fusarium sarcochroum]
MPALTINTDNPPGDGPPSPNRPPVSPLTPPLPATQLPGTEATNTGSHPNLTHSQPDQTGIPPAAPQPIAFDSNPDVIALKSAISILQIQRQRATGDIQALSRAKDEAVQDPEAFIKDLAAGKINAPANDDSDSDDEDEEMRDQGAENKQPDPGEGSSKQRIATEPPAWTNIPQPQNVVRCPPINWSQYAVVGDSLDKLHNEQVARPNQGTPATMGANGMYEFRGEGKQERYQGVAAPYAPTQDRLNKKPKSRKP